MEFRVYLELVAPSWLEIEPKLEMWFLNPSSKQYTFHNDNFETNFDKPRWKNFGFDMLLILRSLVSRLVPLLLGINIHFQLRSKTTVLQGLKSSFPIKIKKKMNSFNLKDGETTDFEMKLLDVSNMSRPKKCTSAYQTLFGNQGFKHMWPPFKAKPPSSPIK